MVHDSCSAEAWLGEFWALLEGNGNPLQYSCLENPMDCSPPGSSVLGIFHARVLEWVAISFSKGIFPTQGSNPHLLHWQAGSLRLSHLGCPNISGGKYLKQILNHELKSPTLEATVSNCLATSYGILLSGHHIILLSTQCWSVCMSNETGIHI